MKKNDPKFELPSWCSSPQEEMYCDTWHIHQKFCRDDMKTELNESNSNYDTMTSLLNKLTFCEDDCKFCTSVTNKEISNEPYFETCVGPEQMKMINAFPEDTCNKYSKKEIQKIFGIGIDPNFEGMIPKTRDEDKMEELCACSGENCRINPSTAINPSDNGLKCHVGFTNDFVKVNKMFIPGIEFPNIPIPPKMGNFWP